MTRNEISEKIAQNPTPTVLIIGGGINGIGTFTDLALQGVDVVLVEKGDFGSGASAASSHMVHGGIRYLENGEFRLVREAVTERDQLLANVPHYVRPLPTTIPIFRWGSGLLNAPLKFFNLLDKPSERGLAVIKAGLILYDSYTRNRVVPPHQVRLRSASLRTFPQMNPDIVATATYYDAAMGSPERIALELLLDGLATGHGLALNYASAESLQNGHVVVRDHVAKKTFSLRPKLVINAGGPWIDQVNQKLGEKTHFIGGTKGSHIVLANDLLYKATNGHEIFFENRDGRIVLIYPLEGRVIVGTTDIKVDSADDVRCDEEEIAYFFDLIKRIFPAIPVSPEQICYTYSGVRPLPATHAQTTGQISRDHKIEYLEANHARPFAILNLVGGKWTTFRAFSQQVTDVVLSRLGKERLIQTAYRPIGGGQGYPRTATAQANWVGDLSASTKVSAERVQTLWQRYGTRALPICQFIAQMEDTPLLHEPTYSVGEITFLCQNEQIVHLTDLLQRRTLLAMMGRLNYLLVHELSRVVGHALGWSDLQSAQERGRALQILRDDHRVDLYPQRE